jgi:hypothetical protein
VERYRRIHDAYPDSLDQLVPNLIKTVPADVIGGLPVRYLVREDGGYALYSIGWNQTDDQGLRMWSRSQPEVPVVGEGLDAWFGYIRPDRGDWVWGQPPVARQRVD